MDLYVAQGVNLLTAQPSPCANLVRLGLQLKDMHLQLVVILYPSLLFEETTFIIGEVVQTFVQGAFMMQLSWWLRRRGIV